MTRPILLMSDPHFTANQRDEYRWGLWKWLREECAYESEPPRLIILGDLTDAKDYHPAALVNRLVGEIAETQKVVEHIYILQGNHDYLRKGHAYFEFLSRLPKVTFITKPLALMSDEGCPTMQFLPHSKDPVNEWAGMDFSEMGMLFIHQTITGAKGENGQPLTGLEMSKKLNAWKVFSGDIHVPQIVSGVEYVGSPYHIHFGDSFKPRCVLIDRKGKQIDLHYETTRRVAVKAGLDHIWDKLTAAEMKTGDQIKVTLILTQAEKHEWKSRRREIINYCSRRGIEIHGIELELQRSRRRLAIGAPSASTREQLSDPEAIVRFVDAEGLPGGLLEAGLEIIK